MNKLICKKCEREILLENDKALKEEYPYYCNFCDENKYEFECMIVEEKNIKGGHLYDRRRKSSIILTT